MENHTVSKVFIFQYQSVCPSNTSLPSAVTIGMKPAVDIPAPQRINPLDLSDPMAVPLAPPSGQTVCSVHHVHVV